MQNDKTVRQRKNNPAASTQRFLSIAEIRDNTLILKNGGMRSILKTSSINFNLKSEEEKKAIIFSYQNFLNTLEFPVQILIRSQKLDIDEYVEDLQKKAKNQKNQLLQEQSLEYIEYVKKLVEYADIMEKKFFVIIPYDPIRARDLSILQKFLRSITPKDSPVEIRRRHLEFAKLRKILTHRVHIVQAGLENCGLNVQELKTEQIIEIFYQIYNPQIARTQKFQNIFGRDLIPM